jgi:hypothetical protein
VPIRPLSAMIAIALLAGCGVGGGTAPVTADVGSASAREVAKPLDVNLAVTALTADPHSPSTATTIVLHLTIANLGADSTPYGYDQGTLRHVPFRYRVSRDGETVAGGEIGGLTGEDAIAIDVTLVDQPPTDKTYVVAIDSTEAIAETDEGDNTATVQVVYGGSG